MGMRQAIKDFPKQFKFEPVLLHADNRTARQTIIVSGMGGSHLAADMLQRLYPEKRIIVHSDYGLPPMPAEDRAEGLFIASSYSGNTEEALDGLDEALRIGMPCAAISTGGRLREIAEKHSLPYVALPETGIQPRNALGFSIRGLMKLMGMDTEMQSFRAFDNDFDMDACEDAGKRLAKTVEGHVPVIYASRENKPLAYNWKIKCNETGKIPAFYNIFPELNHNEMTGFDIIEATRNLSERFHFIFLTDTEDHPRIQKRMEVCRTLFEGRGLPVAPVALAGSSRTTRMVYSLCTADWFAYYTGTGYGAETENVPMVEEFKKAIL